MTTLAVLWPTPGSASSAAKSAGTAPPWRSSSSSDRRLRWRAGEDLGLGQRGHRLRGRGAAEQLGGDDVDAHVGRLRRQHDGDQQGERIDVVERDVGLRVEAIEGRLDLRGFFAALHGDLRSSVLENRAKSSLRRQTAASGPQASSQAVGGVANFRPERPWCNFRPRDSVCTIAA
jgi:hypothetical protein